MKSLSYLSPPQLAVASGATTPNPGVVGATLWSTLEQRALVWDGSAWAFPRQMPEAHFEEVVRVDGRVVAIVNWADETRAHKVSETLVTRDGGWASAIVDHQFDAQGGLVQTLTTVVARDTEARMTSVNTVRT